MPSWPAKGLLPTGPYWPMVPPAAAILESAIRPSSPSRFWSKPQFLRWIDGKSSAAMLSVVDFEPDAAGTIHSHPEEQWGVMLAGSAVRTQGGEEFAVRAGDFWRMPGNVPHGCKARSEGARVLDVFSPPREACKKAGAGFS